jgi:ankyrin repeat protein
MGKAKKNNNISSENTELTTNLSDENPNLELKSKIIKKIREEVSTLSHKPPKESLSYFVYHNKIDDLKSILNLNEIDPNTRDEIGSTASWTPLYWCVKMGRLDCARILLEFGAEINLVINDFEECCGTVLDLAILKNDNIMEDLLRDFAEKDDINLGQSFKAIRTKLRGKAPAFNFRYYTKKGQEQAPTGTNG